MASAIIWSKDAGDEFAHKITAGQVADKINDAIEHTAENAEGRRLAPLLHKLGIDTIHQIDVDPWAIFYRIESGCMEIVSIIDQRRDLEEILFEKVMAGKIL
jgi:toxin ParE1/3/4